MPASVSEFKSKSGLQRILSAIAHSINGFKTAGGKNMRSARNC